MSTTENDQHHVLPGYPIEPAPFSIDKIRAYFDGDQTICLRCGGAFNGLARHLTVIHGITCDEYRQMYGLPWSRGLTSKASRQNRGNILKATWSKSADVLLESTRTARKALAAKVAAGTKARRPNCLDNNRRGGRKPKYGVTVFNHFLELIAGGMTAANAARQPDMPTVRWLRKWRRTHPEDDARLVELAHRMGHVTMRLVSRPTEVEG